MTLQRKTWCTDSSFVVRDSRSPRVYHSEPSCCRWSWNGFEISMGATTRSIIATVRFSKRTVDGAFGTGAAPITLIDGDKLIDLLIEHGIGIRKRTVDLLEVDPSDFTETTPE